MGSRDAPSVDSSPGDYLYRSWCRNKYLKEAPISYDIFFCQDIDISRTFLVVAY